MERKEGTQVEGGEALRGRGEEDMKEHRWREVKH